MRASGRLSAAGRKAESWAATITLPGLVGKLEVLEDRYPADSPAPAFEDLPVLTVGASFAY